MAPARLRERAAATGSALLAALGEPLFFIAWAAVAGILISAWAGPSSGLWWGTGAFFSAVWFLRVRTAASLALLTLAVFALTHRIHSHDPLRTLVETRAAHGRTIPAEITGLVLDAPESRPAGDLSFPLEVLSLSINGEAFPPSGGRLLVRLFEPPAIPAYGDVLSLTGLLERTDIPRNPGEFDFDNYLRVNGFSAEFSSSGRREDIMEITARGRGNPVMAAALRSRAWIGAAVTEDLEDSPDMAAVVRTMMLGTREQTPREVEEAFRASGAMHIFAVSGLHVALFALILRFALGVFGLRRTLVTALSIALMFFYVYVTGLRPSAWRAAIMTALLLSGPLLNREPAMLNHLGAAALLLLGYDTFQLFQPGFVLSFGVILAIAALQRPFTALVDRALGRWTAPDPFVPVSLRSRPLRAWCFCRKWLCESLGLSLASTIGSLPLMIGYFRTVTPAGIVSNLPLILLSSIILAIACLSLAAAGGGFQWLLHCFNNANWGVAWVSVELAKFFAGLPGAYLRVDPARLWRGDPCEITVLALDRGGGAVHIDSPGGRHWLIDCGGLRHFARTVRPHLERSPVNRLDGLILTHSDGAHTGAAGELGTLFSPVSVLRLEGKGVRAKDTLYPHQTVEIDPETRLLPLFPPPGWRAGPQDDRCAVLLLECRGFRILLMGDAGFITEKALLESGADLRADILVKGRHSSDFSGLPEFLNAVRPKAVVFTDADFPAGERVPEEWARLPGRKGMATYNQERTGAVIIRINEDGLDLRGFVNGEPLSIPAKTGAP